MMSILEYSEDVNKSLEEIFKLCDKLEIPYENEETMLTEDDIIFLDNEIQDSEDYIVSESVDEDEMSEEELDEKVEDIITKNNIKVETNRKLEKVKSKKDRVENTINKSNFQKERKNIY